MPEKARKLLEMLISYAELQNSNEVMIFDRELSENFTFDELDLAGKFLFDNKFLLNRKIRETKFGNLSGNLMHRDEILKSPEYIEGYLGYDDSVVRIYELGNFKLPKAKNNSDIEYNEKTGIGSAHGKTFKFKDHQPEFRLFGKLCQNLGEPIKKQAVMEITGFSARTYSFDISALLTKMRKRTGLGTDELVLNNGNVTLADKKPALNRP